MSKIAVTRLFIGGVLAVIAGIVLAAVAFVAMLTSGVVVTDGANIIGLNGDAISWVMIGVAILGVLGIVLGSIVAVVSWIGALLNTVQLEDKTWFVLLLVLGLLSFGFIAMIAYVIGGPDGTIGRDPTPRAVGLGAGA